MNFDIDKVNFEAANPKQKKVAATLIYDADPHLFAYWFKNDYETALKFFEIEWEQDRSLFSHTLCSAAVIGDILISWISGMAIHCASALSFLFNETHETNNEDEGFYLAPPDEFEQQNRTEIYLERIKSLLKPGEGGKKHLILGHCEKLRSQLHNLPSDARKIMIEDFPAVAALAFAVHSIMATKPWLHFLKPEYKIPTIDDHLHEEVFGVDYNLGSQYDEWDQPEY